MPVLTGTTWAHTRGYAPMAATAQVFADHHPGVTVEWRRRSLWAFGEQSLADLARANDLLVIDHPLVGQAVADGLLRPLAGPVTPAIGRSAESYTYGGQRYAWPVDAAAQVAALRPDLLAEAPGDWAGVLELARRTGTVAVPLTPIDAFSALTTLAAGLGARPYADGFLDREIGVRALGMLREVAGVVDPACLRRNPIATLELMASSAEISYLPMVFGYTNYSRTGYAGHLVTFHDLPGIAGSCLGGAGLAVSAFSAEPELAVAYARWVTGATGQRTEFLRAGGQPAALAAWDDPAADELTSGFFGNTRATMDTAFVRPRHPGFPDFQSAAATRVHRALTDGTPAAAVLDELNASYAASRDSRVEQVG